jgi:hypothetical protein
LIAPIQSSDSARSKACGQNRLHLTLRGEQPQGEVWWGASEEMTTTFMVDRPSASYLRRAPTDPTSADRRRRGLHLSASTIGRLALLIDPGLAAAFRIRVKGAVGIGGHERLAGRRNRGGQSGVQNRGFARHGPAGMFFAGSDGR